MEDMGRPSYGGGGDWRPKTVSGSGNRIYTTSSQPHSPDLPPLPAVTRPSQVAAKPWGFNDPEMKRRKRIAKYKVYTVEGRVKVSIRNGFRWIKNKCSELIHGY
ncbi:Hypothetical predicted protein [Olea europaea subsp. europaea]|uniref:Uncharacterized protein n=1 Tax=Olea europaea subsp. europaea TaxID=158383 RepID=A0A8S0PZA1_OLEEU|nr:Hypothetical predicted protein [Olea europaea subsp. europaea]